MHREGPSETIDPATPARSKVEQMLAEVTKARAALHNDTDRLEAMLAGNDGAQDGPGAGSGPGSGAAKPASKNPLDVLAKALRGIKPAEAAPIVSRLDKRLAANVLQRMPPADAGKIMGAMKPDAAAELATQIAARQPLGEARR
jgi:flagellar motility protein MotE (MotC chaperone)